MYGILSKCECLYRMKNKLITQENVKQSDSDTARALTTGYNIDIYYILKR